MPNMIGDPSIGYYTQTSGRSTAPGAVRYNVADDNNTLPLDRVYVNYEHFNGGITANGSPADLNHFVFGAEKTFLGGMASLEVRMPFDSGLAPDQPIFPAVAGTTFGNVSLIPKVVLLSHGDWDVSAGLGIVLPTAPDATVTFVASTTRIANESTHLQPFISADWQNDSYFAMVFASLDFDTTGNPVITGASLTRVFDQNLFALDGKLGYWYYRAQSAPILKAVAPTVELHMTTTISDGAGQFGLADWTNLDLTAGVHAYLRKSILTVFASAPLHNQAVFPGSSINSDFFAEFGVQLDRRF